MLAAAEPNDALARAIQKMQYSIATFKYSFVVGALLTVSLHSWFRLRHRHQLMRDDNELLEARIRERTADLERASRAKSDFVANMSHEIRTPMTAILGYTELLADDPAARADEAKVRETIGIVRRNGEHLLSIINDVLDISKIQAGAMSVEAIPMKPVEILNDVHTLMASRAQAKRIGSCF